MPVEFLSDDQAAAYEGYVRPPSPQELARYFFLDDADRELVGLRRGPHNKLGFALQLVTARYLGKFVDDPISVPWQVVDFLASQLAIEDPSCVKQYAGRRQTHFEHVWEIKTVFGLRDFSDVEAEVAEWVDARVWSTGDGPKAIFDGAVAWLRSERVLLPGVTTLARLVARVREDATQRLWDTLYGLLTPAEAMVLERLLDVADGERFSALEMLRRGPTRESGKGMVEALERISTIVALGMSDKDLSGVPQSKVADLARYGAQAKATLLRRHPVQRRLATLLATVVWLEGQAVDDALELLDLLMATKLVGPARRLVKEETLKRYPRVARDASRLAAAVEVLLEATSWGGEISLEEVWESIEARVSRSELRAAVAHVTDTVPPPEADPDGELRATLVAKIATVRGFVPMLCSHIEFGATKQARPALKAMREIGELIKNSGPPAKKPVSKRRVDTKLVEGSWKRLVFNKPGLPKGAVDRSAYVVCVLEKFHYWLKRREIYAPASSRWRDPRACLLTGKKWTKAKPAVLTALRLAEDPTELLARHETELDTLYREVAGRLDSNSAVTADEGGRLHVAALEAIDEPPSLIDLRRRVAKMLPQVDIGELILEVMAWHPEMVAAFTSVTGREARMGDLDVVIAAALTAHALNIGYSPIVASGQLTRDRISHVDQNYLRMETYAAANTPLVEAQAELELARAWGGGLVAAVDGMRFVVPVRTIHARPNPKYFARGKGSTWLNLVNDQSAGLAGMVVSGTPKDSLHFIDLLYRQEGGQIPEILVTDMGSYSDVVFGLVHLLDKQYRPAPADLPDERLWRADPDADYGALNTAARGRLDLERPARHWPDMLRVVGSIHTGEVRAFDVMRILQRDGGPTPLGDAFAHYGRIFKSRHLLSYFDDEGYRRDIKRIRNLQEGRHGVAKHLFHGKLGKIHQAYRSGMEEQLGALGLVLNCVTLWNTRYMDAALHQLRAQGYPVLDADRARLSPFVHKHINVLGSYSFSAVELARGLRALRDPDAADEDDG